MQRKAAGSFCECRQGDLCFAQTHRHELYLCDFIERRKGREERAAQPRNAKKSRGKFLRVPTGGFVLCTNPPARAVRSRQKLVQHGDSAKCRRNIVGNKPQEVFVSADRGICASHKPTGTSYIYVILLKGARAERKEWRSREMQRKAAGSFCECRQGDLCPAQTHRHELYLCDFIAAAHGCRKRENFFRQSVDKGEARVYNPKRRE